MKKIIVMTGLPSSGRTTYINTIPGKKYIVETKEMRKELMGNYDMYDLDDVILDKSCDECIEKIKDYDTVILDSSALMNQRRLQIYRRVAKYADDVDLVLIDCDPAVCIPRDSEKVSYNQRGSIHILESYRKFEEPNEAVYAAYNSVIKLDGTKILEEN